MTERLYYNDSLLLDFESTVETVDKTARGYEIILKASAFYPESGGQLHDTGKLDGRDVIDIYENESGDVVHLAAEWTAAVGSTVHGSIDRARRMASMRKHTGQHILSRAFIETAGADTVSAHLGEVESTIELSAESIDDDKLHEAELLANQVVLENHPVEIGYYTRDQLRELPVRKIPEVEGKYRIIKVGEFDYTACGGTHCRFSAEVGMIKVIGMEKMRGHVRVTFLTGLLSFEDYTAKHKIVSELSNRFTCHFGDVEDSVAKLVERNGSLRKELTALQKKIMPYEIERLKENGPEVQGVRIVIQSYDDQGPKQLKDLAMQVTRAYDSVAILASQDKLLISVSEGLPTNAAKLAKSFMEKCTGKGGGSPAFAQIGGIPPDMREEYLRDLVNLIKDQLSGG